MENTQPSANQILMGTASQQQGGSNNSKLLVVVFISVLMTAAATGSVVYFWQKSVNDKVVSSLEEKVSALSKTKVISQPTSSPELSPTPTSEPSANLKTYSNEKYGFSFDYPQSWIGEQKGGDRISFSGIAEGHTISVMVWRVTGFGYCYKYGERKEMIVGSKTAETADGVGPSEMCDKPEEYTNRGNTFVLLPVDDSDTTRPLNQIHISYDYPVVDISLAKSNLDQILSTFKFTD